EQYQALARKLQGHFAYYGGVIGNTRCLHRFRHEVMRLWRKWLSRRKRCGQWTWARFNQLLRKLVLPWPRAGVPPCVVNPCPDEPDALIGHVRICGRPGE